MDKTKNKLQLRANILKCLKDIKQEANNSILDFNKALEEFKNIEDKKTLSRIIVQEFKGDNSNYDYFLSSILTQVTPKEAESYIFDNLMSDNISDNKKIYLINILKEINKNADYNALVSSIKNPDTIIKEETKKFAQDIIFNVNHQIDFLDFYFASDLDDKIELVNNLIENSPPNEVCHILSLIIYANDKESKEFIMEKLSSINSYLSYPVLNYVFKNSKERHEKTLAKKYLDELKIKGFRKEIDKIDLYKDALSCSKPLNAWITNIDGASNYVMMFAREHQNSCISFFLVVINLKYGIVECFGFEDLERYEFKEITNKIFKDDEVYEIPPNIFISFLEDAESDSLKTSFNVPYEYYAWRTLTYDIKPSDISFALEKIKLNNSHINLVLKNPFFKSWYLKINDSKDFEKLLNKINLSENIDKIDSLIEKYKDKIFDKNFDKQLLCQSYILNMAGQKDISNILYSLIYDDNKKENLINYILKKSILFYYNEQEENIFAKNINKNVAEIIKKQWQKGF